MLAHIPGSFVPELQSANCKFGWRTLKTPSPYTHSVYLALPFALKVVDPSYLDERLSDSPLCGLLLLLAWLAPGSGFSAQTQTLQGFIRVLTIDLWYHSESLRCLSCPTLCEFMFLRTPKLCLNIWHCCLRSEMTIFCRILFCICCLPLNSNTASQLFGAVNVGNISIEQNCRCAPL